MGWVTRSLTAPTALAAALSVAACAPLKVNASLERSMNFAQYTSYAWADDDRFRTGDPRLDNNEIFESRLRATVDRALAARGLELAPPAVAMLAIHYHASITQQIDVNALDRSYGYCDDCRPSVYDAGTITIDLVDARTNLLVWRGWAEGSFDGIDDQAFIEARVDEAVTRIMRKLPAL